MTYQTDSSALSADEERPLSIIRGTRDFLCIVIIPHVVMLSLFVLGLVVGFQMSGSLTWAAVSGVAALCLEFLVVALTPYGKKCEARITTPLWYGSMAWAIVALAVIFFLWLAIAGPDRVVALSATASIFFATYLFRKVRLGIRSSLFILDGFFHEFSDVFIFYQRIWVAMLLRILWWLRVGFNLPIIWAARIYSARLPATQEDNQQSDDKTKVNPSDVTILHLSDLHLRSSDHPSMETGTFLDETKKDALKKFLSESPDFSLIVVTGDITDNGSATDFEEADRFLRELKQLNLTTPIVLVPGNHDVSVNPCCWKVEGNLPHWQQCVVTILGSSVGPFKNPHKTRIGRFNALAMNHSPTQTASTSRVNLYDFPSLDLSVVALNTAQSSSWILANAAGHFGRDDMEDLETISSKFRRRLLILCHHHVRNAGAKDGFLERLPVHQAAAMGASNYMQLADSLIERLGRSSRNTVVLHGHTHIHRFYDLQNSSGKSAVKIPVRCAPSLLEGERAEGKCAGFLTHKWGANDALETTLMEWKQQSATFAESTRTTT